MSGNRTFQPRRLEAALAARNMTAVELANRVGVTSTTISRWRNSSQMPSSEVLFKLAAELRVTPEWLTRTSEATLSKPYFRGSVAQMKADRALLGARIEWLAEVAEQLEAYVDYPEVNVPRLHFARPSEISEACIESAAMACRDAWGLRDGPIANVVLLLENAGVIVAREETGTARIEGLSAWTPSGRPYVLLCADKANGFRSRFDAAHELGHLVLHGGIQAPADASTHKMMEDQAHRFAGAFLLPAKSFSAEVSVPVPLQHLLLLKKRWGVSVAAMIMRLHVLGVVDDNDKLRLIKLRSAKWGNKQEPLDQELEPETPRLLRRTVELLTESGVLSTRSLSDFLGLSMQDLESLLGFPWGALTQPIAEVVSMVPARVRPELEVVSNGHVVEFARPAARTGPASVARSVRSRQEWAMANSKDIHVVPHADGWAIRREGSDRASVVTDTKAEAMERAREMGRRDEVEVVEHGRDGKIQGSNSYGSDPFPPRDKKP